MSRALLIAVLVAALAPAAVGYDEPPLQSYTRTTADGSHVFAMIYLDPVYCGEKRPSDVIPETYPLSGMYRAADPPVLLWKYGHGFPGGYARDVFPAADGVHAVLLHQRVVQVDRRTCGNSPPEPPLDPVVLSLVASGRVLREVPLSEVVNLPAFAREHGIQYTPWMATAKLDDAAKTFTVEARSGSSAVFDLASGNRVRSSGTGGAWAVAPEVKARVGLAAGLVLAAVAVVGLGAVVAVLALSRGPRAKPLS